MPDPDHRIAEIVSNTDPGASTLASSTHESGDAPLTVESGDVPVAVEVGPGNDVLLGGFPFLS
jgi:hypothetical protein